ncbi:deoxyribose-phosphate aldolase [Halomonas garicola]|uniref:deoxyribose-phosphate aldolase n=1 Tax=Halomonas garicola TaxID=1690008 RepID=UPI00289C90E2|nr:deoxyribose-phosphate aldolase [Halomonas garicola]
MPASINLLQAARQALPLLDVTRLDTADSDADIESLCQQAKTPFGHPAAVCVYPQFVVAARRALTAHTLSGEVKIAAVANFPEGSGDIMAAARETREAVASGADEVDVVLPWRALLDGDEDTCLEFVEMCQAACGGQALLKIILETGELKDPAKILRASEIAIEGGADFLKTSTGKVAAGATPEAASVMLNAIRESGGKVGFKAAGGIDTADDAATYLSLVADIMGPAWITPKNVRFGSTALLPHLVATLAGSPDTA